MRISVYFYSYIIEPQYPDKKDVAEFSRNYCQIYLKIYLKN